MPVTPLRSGDPAVVGPHRLLGRLGQGGMGTVFLGVSPDDRAVAVKVLRDSPLSAAGDADARRRFRHELEVLRRVRGPHLVEVLDADVDAELPYLVTRFVPGQRLDELVAEDGPLRDDDLRRLARGIADALTTLHAVGVVHRDLTPGNVLVLDGSPQVIDLGLAIAADITALTRTGLLVGTAGYLAPEQVTGREVTAGADVHAWGATVALAGTGRPPYGTGRPEAVLYRIVHDVPDLGGLPADLAPLVEDAMSHDPARRPTAAQLLTALGGPSRAEALAVHLPHDVDPTTVLGRDELQRRPTVALTRPVEPGRALVGASAGSGPHAVLPPAVEDTAARDAGPYGGDAHARYADAPYDRPYDDRYGTGDDSPHDDGRYDGGYGDDPDGVAYDDSPPYEDSLRQGGQGGQAAPWDGGGAPQRTSSARSAQVAATGAAAVAVVATGALVAPIVAAVLALLAVVLLRAGGRSAEALALRRERRGERRRDPVMSAFGLPWHLLAAVTDTLVALPLMAVAAALPAGLVWLADPVVNGLERPELTAATAVVVGLLVCLARRAHRRTRLALRRALVTATPTPAAAVAVVAVLLLSSLLLLATAEGAAPTWWPLDVLRRA